MFALATGPGLAEKRVALVIGNAAYQHTPTLTNPVNDAEDLAAALQTVGFTVEVARNLGKRELEAALIRFARQAEDADAAMFFYAGHGVQYRGGNYLMPVDAQLEDEISINYELIRVDDVMFSLERARGVKLLVLDACRNNPLLDRLVRRGATRESMLTRGLARIDPSRGMIVAYSTQPNQVAIDGSGRNSPFTSALVKYIGEPGLEVGSLFRRVAIEVDRATGGRQLPEMWVTLRGEFYLNNRETDLQAWSRIRASNDPAELSAFLKQYPDSVLGAEVRRRIDVIERERAERARLDRDQAERAERERALREQAQRIEQLVQERLAREQAEREQRAREQALRDQIERERSERERVAREAEAERVRREKAAAPQQPPAKAQIALAPPAEPAPPPAAAAAPADTLVADIKKELKRVGCLAGAIDARWATADTQVSVAKFVRFARLQAAPEQPTPEFLDVLKRATARVCPLECGLRQIERNGACVAKICPRGQSLDAEGHCFTVARPKPAYQAAKPQGSGRRCFVLGGRSFCE